MGFTTIKANAILKDLMSGYIGFFTGTPSDDGTGPEVRGLDYQRVPIGPAIIEDKTAINSKIILAFESRSTRTLTHFGIWDNEVGGNLMFWGELTPSVPLSDGYVPLIRANELEISLD